MSILNDKQFSLDERKEMREQISVDFIDNLHRGSLISVYVGMITSLFYLIYYYSQVPHYLLISWFVALNIGMASIIVLNYLYNQFKTMKKIKQWEVLYSVAMVFCATAWGMSVSFFKTDAMHPYLTLSISSMLAAACTMNTIGFFRLFSVCVSLILLPFIFWCLLQESQSYLISGLFISLYLVFLFGINYRSSRYAKNAILLNIENKYFAHQANYDLLTNLPNQRMFIQLLESCVEKSKLNHKSFAVVCFGINRVETFNSELGYQGDLIIQTIANSLNSQFKNQFERDPSRNRVLALPRPDMFGIIIEPLSPHEVEKEIQALFSSLEIPFHFVKEEEKLTASVGVSLYPQDTDNAITLLNNAYSLMFKAKSVKGNHVEYYKPQVQEDKNALPMELENDLRNAIKNNEFQVYYQPIIDLHNGRVGGTEALIRWKHPEKGLISPMDFIPLAEKIGVIVDIGEWILEKSAIQTLAWHNQGFSTLSLKVAVNLSTQQLKQGNLLESIDKMMAKTGLKPQYLDLEITEASLLDETLSPLIKEISQKGINLSIDDFGTGYSGLSYLKTFNIDTIKIDKSLIQKVTVNNESATIVSAILAMAKELGIKTLAEGVETEEQLDFLQKRDCQYVQGYYFCKPLNADKFTRLLESHLEFFENKNSDLEGFSSYETVS